MSQGLLMSLNHESEKQKIKIKIELRVILIYDSHFVIIKTNTFYLLYLDVRYFGINA